MGLEKTLETLACIAGNPPSKEDQKNGLRTTLVIVPANAIDQWISEIGKHCDSAVSHYKRSDTRNEVARQHSPIWITSYNELMQHYPSDNMIRKATQNPLLTAEDCEAHRPQYLGPLFQIRFYRLVLDEAHAIKNHTSRRMQYRTQNTKFFGHALFELPRPHVLEPIMVNMSREEALIYRRVEGILRRKVSKLFRRAKEQNQKVKGRWWLIEVLRLRQAVLHPFLLENMMKDHFEPKDIEWLISELSKIQTSNPFIDQIGHWCEEQLQVRRSEQGSKAPKHEGLDASFDMIRQLEKVNKHKDWEKRAHDLCRRCGFVPDDQFYPKCGHVLCQSCIESYAAENRSSTMTGGCGPCNALLANVRRSLPPTQDPEIVEIGYWRGPSAKKRRGRGDDINGIQPTTKSKTTFLADSDREIGNNMLTPSAKTLVLKSILLDWCKRYPNDKIIVFTLFVDGGRIVGRMLQDANIDFLYYFGSMSHAEKQKAVKDFAEKKEIRVLALNLACANRVIILDMWWNSAMEQQAFGRVYRMGQKKETYFGRILVRNSVDVRLAQLQLAKLEMIAKTIKDHDSSDMALSIEDQAALLGRVVRDEDGNIIEIVADYDDEADTDAINATWNNDEWDQETMVKDI
ncbi:hypothetical protein MYCTH_2070221 [Thermothelomyces thermophilus ATCC 42464]|uniref:RING-type domain-containing protein n=1 Tax=Thermothelomyces thermophilus (strain ATCC 42464 / BCRC 31852 / DSM 1799) TaxID=573729 RepID=G2QL86_THET4|nr:uncharacterized protein MYCTH_2070221 [Thermothelomyces thermophilus ATCC 42464]AEO60718.1 hypothetical protein MYCTH_2070221 [Thermothelomyces thermophilus ATCC 42464]